MFADDPKGCAANGFTLQDLYCSGDPVGPTQDERVAVGDQQFHFTLRTLRIRLLDPI